MIKEFERMLSVYHIWNPAICGCENGKYFASMIDYMWWNYRRNKNHSNKNSPKKKKKVNCKIKTYFLITLALLIAVSIYCCLIKHQAKKIITSCHH